MRKIFVEKSLMEDETFLYGVQMPGFMAMCLLNAKIKVVQFEKNNIKEEDMNDGNMFVFDKRNKPLMRKLSKTPKWDMLIGIAVDVEKETSIDMLDSLDSLDEEENYV